MQVKVTGGSNRDLAHALGTIIKAVPVYKTQPRHRYEIGDICLENGGVVVFGKAATRGFISTIMAALSEAGFSPAEGAPAPEAAQDTLTVEMPLEGFTEAVLANLERLVASKAGVLKIALNAASLPVERDEGTLRFPWFTLPEGGDAAVAVSAYTQLVHKMCEMAKRQKRVHEKETSAENPKWAMRTFLLRLGFVGPEYKTARKILTAGLAGDGAYPGGARPSTRKVTQS